MNCASGARDDGPIPNFYTGQPGEDMMRNRDPAAASGSRLQDFQSYRHQQPQRSSRRLTSCIRGERDDVEGNVQLKILNCFNNNVGGRSWKLNFSERTALVL